MGSTCGLPAAPAAASAEETASCAFVVISRAMKSLLQMFCLVAPIHSTPSDRHNEAKVESIPLNFESQEDVTQFSGSQAGPSKPR